ncbi:MAG: IclR family transcriptional regulator [Actinobacteria bacterium]|nr:MAG: IclR family transcriptional regulator [Actinomycetota bacterium]
MARTGQPSRERVAAASRSLAILDVLAAEGELGTNEIARRTGAVPSTVSRQLATLVESQLVEHVPENGRYRLGIRLVELANSVLTRLDVRTVARPHLEALVAAVGETGTLSVPGDPDAITVEVVQAEHYVRGVSQLGRPSIAHATAAGKVMLAFTDRKPQPPLVAYTRKTVTSVHDLEQELERIRRRGWADAYEEREPELNAIAAPVWSSAGELAGIVALQGPIPRFGRAPARKALPLLLERADAISRELGAADRKGHVWGQVLH